MLDPQFPVLKFITNTIVNKLKYWLYLLFFFCRTLLVDFRDKWRSPMATECPDMERGKMSPNNILLFFFGTLNERKPFLVSNSIIDTCLYYVSMERKYKVLKITYMYVYAWRESSLPFSFPPFVWSCHPAPFRITLTPLRLLHYFSYCCLLVTDSALN